MSPDLKRPLWLLALVVLLAVPLAFLLSRTFGVVVRDIVAVPILYLGWIGRLYLRTVPQALFWGALLLFGLVLAITNVLIALGGLGEGERGYQQGMGVNQVYIGRVKELTSQIHFAARSAYFRRRLAQRLGRLILKSLDYEEPYGPAKVEQGLEALDAPPEVRAFLQEGEQLISPSRPGLIVWLRRRLRGRQEVGAPDLELERVVQFLEERLEVL